MKIQLLSNDKINKKAWDECLHNCPGFELYLQSSYLDQVFPGWKALIANDYEAIFPVFEKKIIFWKSLRQPLFTGPCSVIGTVPEAIHALLNYLPDFIAGYDYIDFNILPQLDGLAPTFSIEQRKFQKLTLGEEGFKLTNELKRNCKKASAAGIQTLANCVTEDYLKGLQNHLLNKHKALSRKGIRLLTKLLGHKASFGGICTSITDSQGLAYAAQFFLQGKNNLYIILSYSTPEGRNHGALHSLQIKMIEKYLTAKGSLHFGGSNIERIAEYNYNYKAQDIYYQRIVLKKFPFNFL